MIWPPYSILKNTHKPFYVESANKEFLYDRNNKEYIDAVSSWWISIHGHNHPKIIESVKETLSRLDHIILAGQTHKTAIELAEKLISITSPAFHSVFYSDNGSCAVDIAIKIAYQYFQNLGLNNKKEILHFSSSYHGDTIGAMSVSGKSSFNSKFEKLGFYSPEFISPNCNDCPMKKDPYTCQTECIQTIENYAYHNSEKICAIIIEPIVQAALGMKFYKKEVLQKLEAICMKNNILLILDEVFTGFGRLGKLFAYQYADIKPDIITLAKGLSGGVLPLAATLVNEKVYVGFDSADADQAFYHGHTMTGNPSATAAAIASIELFESENRIEDIQRIEKYFEEKLIYFQAHFAEKIFNPRTKGTIFAFEIGNEKNQYLDIIAKALKEFAFQNQVLLRPLGNTIYITPPYIISKSSLDQIFSTIENYLQYQI